MANQITSTQTSLFKYSRPSSVGITGEVHALRRALENCDWQEAQSVSMRLVQAGRGVIAKQIKQDRSFDPIPMTLRLVEALNSPDIQWQEEVKYHIARATRLFMELACMKAVLDNKKVYRDTQETLRASLDRLIDYSKDKPTLLYELKCTSEALKLMEETDTKGYLTALFSAASDPSISSVMTLIGLLPGLLAKKSKDWFSEALFLSWMGPFARDNKDLFFSLTGTLKENLNTLAMAQTGVEFLADIVWNGTPELQQEALSGEISLITLLNKQKPSRTIRNLIPTMWPVRYRTVQVLSTLIDHPTHPIAQAAQEALLTRRVQESNPEVKALLTNLEQNPRLCEQWKLQFEQEKSVASQEQADFKKQEARLAELERQLSSTIHSQRLSQEEILQKQQALEQERQYVQELREQCEAQQMNAAALSKQFNKSVNALLDDVFSLPKLASDGPPTHLCCPLSLDLMIDPVTDAEGNTFERTYIENWLKMHGKSPLTRTPMTAAHLVPNRSIKQAVEEYRKQQATPSPINSSPAVSSKLPSRKEAYSTLLTKLYDIEDVKNQNGLSAILERLFDELSEHDAPDLTPQLEKTYILVEKLYVDQKVSTLVCKKLIQLYGPSPKEPAALQAQLSLSTSVATSSPPLMVKQSPEKSVGETEAPSRLTPAWINMNPTTPLKSLGLVNFDQMKDFLKQHGDRLTCLNLKGIGLVDVQFQQLIQSCKKLNTLLIKSSKLTDEALKHLKGMSLTSIDFSWCQQLTDKGLEHLKGMQLTSVNFTGCKQLTDTGLEHLKGMPLASVNFTGCNQLTDTGLEHLKGMLLTRVHFTGCKQLTDKGLEHLKGMPLTSVKFAGCNQLTDTGLEHLKGMQLTSVDFNRCYQLTDKGLEHLKGMPLTTVNFDVCKQLTDKGLEHLKGMPLTSVNFGDCKQLTDTGLEHLKGMQLTSVDFHWCDQLTDKGLEHLKGMSLTSVHFGYCKRLTGKGLEHLKGMPLTSIDFDWCDQLTDKGLEHLKGKPLTSVVFGGCKQLTDKGLEHLKGMPLTSVNFGWCDQLTDKGLEHLKGMPLTSVNFYGCNRLTDKGLEHLKGMPLTSVVFGGCKQLTDKGLEHLKGMPLTSVDFGGCQQLTDKGLEHLKGMPLARVNFEGCQQLTDKACQEFEGKRGVKIDR